MKDYFEVVLKNAEFADLKACCAIAAEHSNMVTGCEFNQLNKLLTLSSKPSAGGSSRYVMIFKTDYPKLIAAILKAYDVFIHDEYIADKGELKQASLHLIGKLTEGAFNNEKDQQG